MNWIAPGLFVNLVAGGVLIFSIAGEERPPVLARATVFTGAEAATSGNVTEEPSAEKYAQVERWLSAERAKAPGATPAPAPAPPPPPTIEAHRLVGILFAEGESVAIIRLEPLRRVVRLRLGESIGEWTLVRIARTEATLRSQSQTRNLALDAGR